MSSCDRDQYSAMEQDSGDSYRRQTSEQISGYESTSALSSGLCHLSMDFIEDGYVYIDGVQYVKTENERCYVPQDADWRAGRLPRFLHSLGTTGLQLISAIRPPERADQSQAMRDETSKDLGVKLQKLLSQQARCSQLRAQASPMRSQLIFERQEHLSYRHFVLDSLQRAIEPVESAADFTPPPSNTGSPHLQLLKEDQQRLYDQTKKVDNLERALSNVEYRLQQEEEAWEKGMHDLIDVLRALGLNVPDETALSSNFPPSNLEPEETPGVDPLLEDFYDKLGDAKVIHERLIDFENDYNEARTRIIFDEEHERTPEMTLHELEASSTQDRMQLQAQLDRACEIADAAKAACLGAGLDPDAYKTFLADRMGINQSTTPEAKAIISGSGEITPENLQSPASNGLTFRRQALLDSANPTVADLMPRKHGFLQPEDRTQSSPEMVLSWRQTLPVFDKESPSRTEQNSAESSVTPARPTLRRTSSDKTGKNDANESAYTDTSFHPGSREYEMTTSIRRSLSDSHISYFPLGRMQIMKRSYC